MSELATTQAEDFTVTGGSDPNTEALLDLRHRLLSRPDVMRVLDLKPHPTTPGQTLYLVETHFQFPRFVIGQTGPDLEDARPLLRCSLEWSACDYWTNQIDLL